MISTFQQAAEAGNLDEIIRLFQFDNTRLRVKDGRGRTIAHQAAAKNRTNILQFVNKQEVGEFSCFKLCSVWNWLKLFGTIRLSTDLDAQDNLGNTPLHSAVENDSFEAIEFLLQT